MVEDIRKVSASDKETDWIMQYPFCSLNNFSWGEALLSIYLELENTLKGQPWAKTFGSQLGMGKGKKCSGWNNDGILPVSAVGKMPACQLFWELELSQSEAGAKKLRSDTCVDAPMAPAQMYSMKGNRNCTFVCLRLCWMVEQHYINYLYLNMSESLPKISAQKKAAIFWEFRNTKDFRFIKSAILEGSFNYSVSI